MSTQFTKDLIRLSSRLAKGQAVTEQEIKVIEVLSQPEDNRHARVSVSFTDTKVVFEGTVTECKVYMAMNYHGHGYATLEVPTKVSYSNWKKEKV